jgi:hypothetical protein
MSAADEYLEATESIRWAEMRAAERDAAYQPIDYAAMKRTYPRQKAALARAI